ncbi:MAG: hypothetical protein ACE5KF_01680 [Kiloniellaceae bacterium]
MKGMSLALVCLGMLVACSDHGAEIDAVKAAGATGMNNEEMALRLAGPKGTVEWSGRKPDQYPKASTMVLVEATIQKPTGDGAERSIVIQYLYNRTTEQVSLFEVLVDGEPQGILAGALQMLLLRFE